RRLIARGAQGRDDAEPVEAGQHAIDDHRIEAAMRRPLEAFAPIAGEIDAMAALAQTADEIVGGFAIIFHDQDMHAATIERGGRRIRGKTGGAAARLSQPLSPLLMERARY